MKLAYTTPNSKTISIWKATESGRISKAGNGWDIWYAWRKTVGEKYAEKTEKKLVSGVPSVYATHVELKFEQPELMEAVKTESYSEGILRAVC